MSSQIFRSIARNELLLLKREPLRFLVGALLLALAVWGVSNGAHWTRIAQRAHSELGGMGSRQLETALADINSPAHRNAGNPDPTSPFAMSVPIQWVTIPALPWSVTAVGTSDVWITTSEVHAWSNPSSLFAHSEPQNPSHLSVGRVDLAFVVVVLLPLALLAWTYDVLSAEREQGTLRLALAQPVSVGSILLARLGVRAGLVCVPFLLVSVMAAVHFGAAVTTTDGFVRLLLWAGTVVLYASFWIGLAAGANTMNQSSTANMICLAAAWTLFTFVIPSGLDSATRFAYPTPSRAQLVLAERDASLNTWQEGRRVLAELYRQQPDLRPTRESTSHDDWRCQIAAVFLAEVDAVQPHVERRIANAERRYASVRRASVLSPAALTQLTLHDIAGTGAARYRRLLRQADEFIAESRSFFFPKLLRGETLTRADYAHYPVFQYQDVNVWQMAKHAGMLWIGLLALNVPVPVLIAYRLSQRRIVV